MKRFTNNTLERAAMSRAKMSVPGLGMEYAGPNPISNMAKIAGIAILGGFFTTTVACAGSLVVWYAKEVISRKKGWKKQNEKRSQERVMGSCNSMDRPFYKKNSLKSDVEVARRNGAPSELRGKSIFEGDRVVLVSGPGVGKSILAVQLSIGIASGEPCGIFPDERNTNPQPVLLIDAEQEQEDLFMRYRSMSDMPSNIARISSCSFNSTEELIGVIHKEVVEWETSGTVVIDNITSLISLRGEEIMRDFYGRMRSLQDETANRGHKLTFIVLGHVLKSASKLTLQSIQGSGNIGNFATSVFALERYTDGENLRLFKVLKARRSSHQDNEFLLKLVTNPYLHFEYHGTVTEALNSTPESECNTFTKAECSQKRKLSDELISEIQRLHAQGVNVNSLAKQFGVNRNTIIKYLKLTL